VPPSSSTKYDPERHRISNRPCQINVNHKGVNQQVQNLFAGQSQHR
jgi:hypothetical protein